MLRSYQLATTTTVARPTSESTMNARGERTLRTHLSSSPTSFDPFGRGLGIWIHKALRCQIVESGAPGARGSDISEHDLVAERFWVRCSSRSAHRSGLMP